MSFWWRDIVKLLDQFKGIATVTVGQTVLFWEDSFIGPPLALQFPELYSFTKKKHILLNAAIVTQPQ